MILNAIVLILEVLYYSLFLKFAKRQGKLWRYIILFIFINVLFYIVGTTKIYSYLILIITIMLGLKCIIKLEIKLYDIFFVFLMLIFKTIIETMLVIPLFYIINNMFIATLIASLIKIGVIILLRDKLNSYYNGIKVKWDNNNFYIRYIFTIAMFLYVIASCLFLIFNR